MCAAAGVVRKRLPDARRRSVSVVRQAARDVSLRVADATHALRRRHDTVAASHPRTLLKNATPSAFARSSTSNRASATRPSASSAARHTPGSSPAETGGVSQRPSMRSATLPIVVSVSSPAAFQSSVSNAPPVGVNAA